MQTIGKAVQAFMRPIGPYPWWTECRGCGKDMVLLIGSNDPFQWNDTMSIVKALDQIRLEAGLQRHADLFG